MSMEYLHFPPHRIGVGSTFRGNLNPTKPTDGAPRRRFGQNDRIAQFRLRTIPCYLGNCGWSDLKRSYGVEIVQVHAEGKGGDMTAVTFTVGDSDNLELVRQIVLRRLKDGVWNQLYEQWDEYHAGKYVTFQVPNLENRFIVLVLEVMWQLIIQGVITPGKDAPNPELPWFRVTSYGKTVLETERFVPHDPTGYMNDVKNVAKSEIGKAALPYLEEALRCFTSGCHVAAVLMLGIAAEAVFLGLCMAIERKLKNAPERAQFQKLQWVKPKHRWVVDKYQALPASDRKGKLPESLDITLTSLYELIRRQRNELGHPSERMPTIGRELAFVHFRLFPAFIEDVEAFATYCKKHGI